MFGKQHTCLANSTHVWQTAHMFGKQHTCLFNGILILAHKSALQCDIVENFVAVWEECW